jgi:hypothetical protein
MLRGSKRVAIVSCVFLIFAAGASPQLRAKPYPGTVARHVDEAQPTDPNLQRRSPEIAMKESVNPTNRNYGLIFTGWQDTMVRYTIESLIWWAAVIAFLLLIGGGLFFWWYSEMWTKRQACFENAAAILIGQRNTAMNFARYVVEKHNEIVDRLDQFHADHDGDDLQSGAVLGGAPVADNAELTGNEVREAKAEVVVLDEDAASVETQAVPGESATVYKIKGEEFVKKDVADRQLVAEKQRSTRLSSKNKQLQDQLFRYES